MDRTQPPRTAGNAPPARQPTRLAFHATRIIIDVGFLIVLGSMSLPFVSSTVGDRSAMTADALPTLLLLIPVFLITLLPDHTRPIPMPFAWISLVLGAAAFPYAVVKFLDAANVAETVGGTVSLGARLLVLGSFVTLVGIAVALVRGLMKLPTGGAVPGPRPQPRPAAANRPRGTPPQQPVAAPRPQAGTQPSPRPERPHQPPGSRTEGGPSPRPTAPPPRTPGVPPGGTQPPRPGAGPDRDRGGPQPRRPGPPDSPGG